MSALTSALALRFGELSFESRESSGDEYSEFAQRWKNMLAFEGQPLAEQYAHGRIAFVCDLYTSFLRGNHESSSTSNSPFGNRELFASFVYVADIANPLKLQMGDDEPMFVLNVETVKSPEGITTPPS
jgi:hypothetical protein